MRPGFFKVSKLWNKLSQVEKDEFLKLNEAKILAEIKAKNEDEIGTDSPVGQAFLIVNRLIDSFNSKDLIQQKKFAESDLDEDQKYLISLWCDALTNGNYKQACTIFEMCQLVAMKIQPSPEETLND